MAKDEPNMPEGAVIGSVGETLAAEKGAHAVRHWRHYIPAPGDVAIPSDKIILLILVYAVSMQPNR